MQVTRTLRFAVLLACTAAAGCTAGDEPSTAPSSETPSAASQARPASAPTRAPSDREVIAERLPYAEVDDELVYGHFAFPEDMIDPLPAVIVVHDWWGLNDEMRATANRLASEGFIVLAVDLFRGDVAESPAQARDLEIDVVENPDMAIDNLKQATDFIRHTAGAPSTAMVGFGFGGGWSLNAALEMPGQLEASVIYYGQTVTDEEALAGVDAPILGMFADGDRAVPPEAVRKFESALEDLEKEFEIHIYEDARRGFADELSDNFDARIDADAFNRMLEFLEPRMTYAME